MLAPCGLLKNDNNKVQTKTKGRRGTYLKGYVASSSQSIEWTEQHQETLEKLIDCLVKPPVLGFPDFTKAFVLHTDASNLGLGAVLYQHLEGKLRVIAYGSRTLTTAEQNYHLHSGKLSTQWSSWLSNGLSRRSSGTIFTMHQLLQCTATIIPLPMF